MAMVPLAFNARLKNRTQYSRSLLSDSSSPVTAWRQSIGFLERQARRPSLHFAKALSFSVCVQGRLHISSSRSAILTRVRLAIVWLSSWKSMHSKDVGSKHFPTGSHASQHRSLAPRLSGVLRESSRTVCLCAFSRIIFKSASAPNGSAGCW